MTGAAHAVLPAGLRLRTHQQAALDALRAREVEGRRRSWVVLPPGAGKTLVGLVTAGEQLGVGAVSHVVVLCPNAEVIAERERTRSKTGYPDRESVFAFDRILREETPRIGFWLDNSSLSVAETVEKLLDNLGWSTNQL